MIVFSYFDASPNLPDQGQLIRLWHDSWKRHGWTPRLLHPRNAQRHPWWEKALDRWKGIPPPLVARWFALDQVAAGSALFTGYSVMNFGLRPFRALGPFSCYGCDTHCLARSARRRYLREYLDRGRGPMSLFRHREIFTASFGDDGWKDFSLVRFEQRKDSVPVYREVLDCGRKIY